MAQASKTLSERRLQALSKKLRTLLDSAEVAVSDEKLACYWKIGELIAAERIAKASGYHNSILADLARETHVAMRTLQRAVILHDSYSQPPTANGLSWTHYRVLLQLSSPKEREFYAALARKEGWNTRQLRAAVLADQYGGRISSKVLLTRPSDPSYLYQAELEAIVDGDTLDLLVDVGFHTLVRQHVRLARIDAPEIDTVNGRAARNFVAEQLFGARTLVVKTHKTDLYGRYVADVFFSSAEVTLLECFSKGTYLNDLLLQHKHAVQVG